MKKLYEVKVTTYTQVWARNEKQAEEFAKSLLDTIEAQNVEGDCDLVIFSIDDTDVLLIDQD